MVMLCNGIPANITPSTSYPLTVTVSNPNGLAERAGFQFTILNANNQMLENFHCHRQTVFNTGRRQAISGTQSIPICQFK